MLFDKWKASTLSPDDPDHAVHLDNWIWDNIGEVFSALGDVDTLRRILGQCRHFEQKYREYEREFQAEYQKALDALKRIAFADRHRINESCPGRIASDYLQTVLCNRCGSYLDGFGNCDSCASDQREEWENMTQ